MIGEEENSSIFKFYITNIVNPWGKGAESNKILKARQSKGIDYDFDRKNLDLLNITWPIKATLPVPFVSLFQLFENKDLSNWKKNYSKLFVTNSRRKI